MGSWGEQMIRIVHIPWKCVACHCWKIFRSVSALLILVFQVGCGDFANQTAYWYQSHYILVHKDGQAIPPPDKAALLKDPSGSLDVNEPLSTQQLRNQLEAVLKPGIDRFVANLPSACSNQLKILIIVHGGMNGYQQSSDHMVKLLRPPLSVPDVPNIAVPQELSNYEEPPPVNDTCYYPIFLNWDSDLGDALADDLIRIRFGQKHRILAPVTAPFVVVGRVLGSIANLFPSLVANGLTVADAYKGAGEEGDPLAARLGDAGLYFPVQALYTVSIPFGEGFGAPAWGMLKRRVDQVVASGLTPERNGNQGAGRTLFEQLRSWMSVDDQRNWHWNGASNPPVSISLVGHSMGTMILNRLLEVVEDHTTPGKHVSLPIESIIYLAPASSINEADSLLLPFLERNTDTKFWLFILNRRDESREISLKGSTFIFPRGSLLTWIDTFLETETGPGQATMGWLKNLSAYYSTAPYSSQKTTFSEYFSPAPTAIPTGPESSWRELHDIDWRISNQRGRLVTYVSKRRVWMPPTPAPEEHGDFLSPLVFRGILCMVDRTAFWQNSEFCSK